MGKISVIWVMSAVEDDSVHGCSGPSAPNTVVSTATDILMQLADQRAFFISTLSQSLLHIRHSPPLSMPK